MLTNIKVRYRQKHYNVTTEVHNYVQETQARSSPKVAGDDAVHAQPCAPQSPIIAGGYWQAGGSTDFQRSLQGLRQLQHEA